MSKMTEAERFLLEQIRGGDNEAWARFVDRYRGRLLTFAQTKLGQRADAEDIVQDTFVAFVTGLGKFRGESGIETYLFTILRRKIINSYRSAHNKHICLLQDVYKKTLSDSSGADSDAFGAFAAPDMTASFYARRDEQDEILGDALADALTKLVNGYKSSLNFRDMEIVELLFFSQLSNQDVAKIVGVGEKNIAVIKHRCLRHVREHVANSGVSANTEEAELENLLTQVWEQQRLSCPKRSTVGAFLLGTLDSEWQSYLDFHLNKLGCHFCRANLEDLKKQTEEDESRRIQERIMESTIGFLHKPR